MTDKDEKLVEACLPQACELFVVSFRLIKVERPDGCIRLTMLAVRVLAVGILGGVVSVFCMDIGLDSTHQQWI